MAPARKGRAGSARKAPTNLSLRADLVRQARALHLNLSDLLERALERAIADRLRERWLEDNRESIRTYNAQIEQRGVFSDGWRRF